MESNYAEENISTKQPSPREKTRFQGTDGDQKRPRRAEAASGKGTQAFNGTALLSLGFPKDARLRKRAEFLRVYEGGARIDGRFMTVFILPNGRGIQRAGITATKKAIGKAHDRNRAKRLLRESFRLSRAELDAVTETYDWVLNARRGLLHVKLAAPLTEFRGIIKRVGRGDFAGLLPRKAGRITQDEA